MAITGPRTDAEEVPSPAQDRAQATQLGRDPGRTAAGVAAGVEAAGVAAGAAGTEVAWGPPAGVGERSSRTGERPPGAPHLPLGERVRAHAALLPVLALAAFFDAFRLDQNGYANTFYSAGVYSMLRSLHNFLFVAADPGGLVTIDKPPLALWVQALSAKLFGFAPLALLAPEALAGVLTVALLYAAMVRPFGRSAALAGAVTLALFPSFVAVSRDNLPDPLMLLLMTAGCAAALRATRTGGIRALLLSALLVGAAFNTKTLAAYIVVPPIALAYLLCAPGTLGRRLRRLALAGLLLAVTSLAWIAFVEATPASQRPYVGSSTDNSELGLTFAYNGLGRVGGQEGGPGEVPHRPGASLLTTPAGPSQGAPHGAPHGRPAPSYPALEPGHHAQIHSQAGSVEPLRLLDHNLGAQGGWMLPFALCSLIALVAAVRWRGRPSPPPDDGGRKGGGRSERRPDRRSDPRAPALIVLGGWFALEALVLSVAGGIVHPYYVSALGPGTAATVGAGAALFARRLGSRRIRALFVLAVLATVAAQVVILERSSYLSWLPWLLLALGALVILACCLPRLAESGALRRIPSAAVVTLILGALLVAPAAYAATTWLGPVQGTFPAVGTSAAGGTGGIGLEGEDPRVFADLIHFLRTHGATRRYSVLAVAAVTAAPLVLMGTHAAAIGGYGGSDPTLDGAQLARLVRAGQARYVLLGGPYSERGGNRATAAVLRACRALPAAAWGGPPLAPYSYVLFDCAGRADALAAAATGARAS